MPLVLTQHASRDLNRYLDREWVTYHFAFIAHAGATIVAGNALGGNLPFL